MPQSSEQYLELALAACTQLGPRHWCCPELSRRSPFSLYLVLSLCFCFCLCRRDSFWIVPKRGRRPDVSVGSSQSSILTARFNKDTRRSYFLVKLLFSSLDMLHLHSFLTHDRTKRWLIIIITGPCLGERRPNTQLNVKLPIAGCSCCLTASVTSRFICNNFESNPRLPWCCQVLLLCTAGTDRPHCRSRQSIACVCGRNYPVFLAETVLHPLHAAFSAQKSLHNLKWTTRDCTNVAEISANHLRNKRIFRFLCQTFFFLETLWMRHYCIFASIVLVRDHCMS